MKKAFSIPILMTLLLAVNSSAVTISWAVTTLPETASIPGEDNYTITSAVLVYTTLGYPVYEGSGLNPVIADDGGTEIGSKVTQIYPWGIGEQLSEDTTTRSEGAYYVVLFASDGDSMYYATSTAALNWNDSSGAISEDPMAPPTATYDPAGFQGWQPIPEPGTASLLFAGLATVLLRRRRRS